MTWTKITLSMPDTVKDQANKIFAIIDPDIGGAKTFGEPRYSVTGDDPATHHVVTTAIKQDTLAAVIADLDKWKSTIGQLAQARGRDSVPDADIEAVHSALHVGENHGLLPVPALETDDV